MNLVEKAERKSRDRAVVFYLMALCLLLSAMTSDHQDSGSTRLIPWFVMVGGAALNLSSAPFRLWKWNGMASLLNDETTRDHRRSTLAVGFWAMLIAASLTIGVSTIYSINAVMTGRVTITAGLMAALIAFATLELRASR
ncbi:hypothetical protein [Sphingomonas fuzhouensis]|uniref:hypothetical protein n=1 Tax=Sphingomonas fuzhouensis TaxID=3106033 RepID=UPI002AFF0642|nr:hypothetical protein [Sphingomonas sp. SGZ-02]